MDDNRIEKDYLEVRKSETPDLWSRIEENLRDRSNVIDSENAADKTGNTTGKKLRRWIPAAAGAIAACIAIIICVPLFTGSGGKKTDALTEYVSSATKEANIENANEPEELKNETEARETSLTIADGIVGNRETVSNELINIDAKNNAYESSSFDNYFVADDFEELADVFRNTLVPVQCDVQVEIIDDKEETGVRYCALTFHFPAEKEEEFLNIMDESFGVTEKLFNYISDYKPEGAEYNEISHYCMFILDEQGNEIETAKEQ